MNYGKKGVRERQKTLNSKSAKWGRKLTLTCVKVFLIICVALFIIGAATGIGMFKGIIASTPKIEISALVPSGQASIVYDNAGNEIDRFVGSNANRTIVTMDQVPKYLGLAFVAIEDERFFEHNGIDVKGLFRAGYQFFKTRGSETQGASTITQQLLKNAIFTDWTSEGRNFIKKVKRKFQEQYLAIEVTKNTEKDQVLLAYMNTINCGQNTLGVEAASLRYFGKSCSELTLSECAVIACITNNPSGYNPIRFPEKNAKRRESCLNKMLELNFITKAEYDEAMADTEAVYERISSANHSYMASSNYTGTYFTDALQEQVLDDLVERLGYSEAFASNLLLSGGLKIYSTQDSTIQSIVNEEFSKEENFPDNTVWYLEYAMTATAADGTRTNYSKEMMMSWFKKNGYPNFNLHFLSQEEGEAAIATYEAAVIPGIPENKIDRDVTFTAQPQASISIIDDDTGYVVAMMGGRGSKEGRLTLNRVTGTSRQPGSTFKMLAVYAPAIDSAGKTLASVYNDTAFNYEDGTPLKNSNDKFDEAPLSLRNAIMRSKNIIAVKTLTEITPQLGYDYLLNFGFTTLTEGTYVGREWKTDIIQATALGGITFGVKNIELCAAYATIANQGAYIEPKLYSKVLDCDGNVLLDNTHPDSRQVIKPTTAYLLTDAMVDVVTSPSGTGTMVNFDDMAIAGKTGTTSNKRDVWFAGFTPYYTCVTWVGYDSNHVLDSYNKKESDLAKKLWHAVMSRVHENLPNEQFVKPEGIVTVDVCSKSGKLPISGLCDAYVTTAEYFAIGTEPTESCDVHYTGMVCMYDNLQATSECPFATIGTCTLPLIEDESLWTGSTTILPDGTVIQPKTSSLCQHDIGFFIDPNYQSILAQQQWELQDRSSGIMP